MRQVGILAASGLMSLEKMVKRLYQDHENARYLADCLSKIPYITVDLPSVHINMVFFKITKPDFNHTAFSAHLLDKGIKSNPGENGEYRFVTHNDVNRENIDYALSVINSVIYM